MTKGLARALLGTVFAVAMAVVPPMALAQSNDQTPQEYGWGGGYGPGMMGGYGYGGYGPGMMGGYGRFEGYGMGPGMMWGGPVWLLDLSTAQRDKIFTIQTELRNQNWPLMGQIMDQYAKLGELYNADTLDAKQVGAVYGRIFALRKQMIMAGVEATSRELAVLTPEQREQLRKLRGGGYPGAGWGWHRGPMRR